MATYGQIKSDLEILAGRIVCRNLADDGFETMIPATGVGSNPPQGGCKVTNIYVNPSTGKLIVEYDNVPV